MSDLSTVTVSREVLDETPERCVKFQCGVVRKAGIRKQMLRRGYTQQEHDKGVRLLQAVLNYQAEPEPDEAYDVRGALRILNETDEDLLTIIDASLRHTHPEVRDELLSGLQASRGEGEAHLTVSVVLQRMHGLEQSDAGRLALERLAARGIDAAERGRLETLVETATRVRPVCGSDAASREAADEQYVSNLRRLRGWYEEWSSIARAAIKRRDYLITLGLARRRTTQRGATAGDSDSSATSG